MGRANEIQESSTRPDVHPDIRGVAAGRALTSTRFVERLHELNADAQREPPTADGDAEPADGDHEGRRGENEVFSRPDEG